MEAVQCARLLSRLWTAFSISFVPCCVSAFLESLCAGAMGSASGGSVMLSPHSGWRRCAAPFDDSRLLVQGWLSVWSPGPWLYLAAVFTLVFSQPGFWLLWLDHHLLWQVAPLLSTLSVFW